MALISLGVCDYVIQCLHMSSPDVQVNAFHAMMNLAREDGGAFTKSGACEVILKMLPGASASGSPQLIAMLDCMYALGIQNPERQKKFEGAKGPLMHILSRYYENPLVHKKAVIIASLLAYSTDNLDFFRPLVLMIRSYYGRMPQEVEDQDPHEVNVRRVCMALLLKYKYLIQEHN